MLPPSHELPQITVNDISYMGNISIWELPKVAFLCSRKVPAVQVLKCYDWAINMREKGTCVMLGAHSQLEKDVLHYLLKGSQPVVLVLARGMKKRIEPELKSHIDAGRLLLVAPFAISVTRVTKETAIRRNDFMLENSQNVTIGHLDPAGLLARSLSEKTLDVTVL